jgi:tripartite-type tricarboxylate transporter receptor subunit TctC
MDVVTTRRAALAGAALLPWAGGVARAQPAWPSRPVRWVVPFPPGGGIDVVARLITARLTETLGRPFIVENVAGGSGVVGASGVARAEPDGHTMLVQTYSSAVVNPTFMSNMPYDPVAAFTPISLIAMMPMLIVVNPEVPARTVSEFIALVKANPGKFNYGSSGPRTAPHLGAELFRVQAGLDMLHVPYRGTGPAALALLSGEVSMLVDSIAGQRGYIQAGRARPLAMLGRTRSPLLPDVPTLAESGLPDYEFSFWGALFGPAGLPAAIAERQADAVRAAVAEPALAARLADLGVESKASTPTELDRFFRAELAATRAIVERTRIPLE